MKKILTVLGARPQFVKAAPVSMALTAYPQCQEMLVHTGQHYDEQLSAIFWYELPLPAISYNLEIGSASHGEQTGRMLSAIEAVLIKESPDLVLVYGDTNSTLAGALAATKMQIPVAHVEAGLRSFNRKMPEEINRVAVDHIADILFPPTQLAYDNLLTEGVEPSKIHCFGDVMYDAALYFAERALEKSSVTHTLQLQPRAYLLATIHRPENTDDVTRLRNIFQALESVAQTLPVIVPLHPRTQSCLQQHKLLDKFSEKLTIIPAVSFFDMICLEKQARVIVTDSGGVQKEAFFYQTPCVTVREQTEWQELIDAGWNRLVSADSSDAIIQAVQQASEQTLSCDAIMPYGQGDSAQHIAAALIAAISKESSLCAE